MKRNRSRRTTLAFDPLEDRCNPAPFTVDNGSWDPTAQSTLPNHGSLPWCIAQANATPGVNDIFFDYTPGGLVPAGAQIGTVTTEGEGNPPPGGNPPPAGNAGGSSGVTLTSTATLSVIEGVRIWGGGGGQYVIITGVTPFKFMTGDSEIHGMAFDKCKPDVNAVEKKGGAIQVKGGKLTTFNTRFSNNTANDGGAVFVGVFGTLVVDGDLSAPPDTINYGEQLPGNTGKSRTLFQKNISNTDGGAIESEGTVILKRVSFYQNTAASMGGGINNNSVTASVSVPVAPPPANGDPPQQSALTDVTFRQNFAVQGGAMSVKGGTVDLIGVFVQANSAGGDGGGFCVLNGTVNVKDSTVTGNTAVKGAAVYLRGINNDTPMMDLYHVTLGGNNVLPGGTAAIDVSTRGTLDTHGCLLNGDLILPTIAGPGQAFGVHNPDPLDPDTP